YGDALQKILVDVRAGTITTPAAANTAFAPFKDQVEDLDETLKTWYESHEQRTFEGAASIERAMSRALVFTFVMTLIALAGRLTIAFLLARSIRRPIASAVAGAREVAQGRFAIDAREELGQVQQAFDGVRGLLIETRELKSKIEADNRELQDNITE